MRFLGDCTNSCFLDHEEPLLPPQPPAFENQSKGKPTDHEIPPSPLSESPASNLQSSMKKLEIDPAASPIRQREPLSPESTASKNIPASIQKAASRQQHRDAPSVASIHSGSKVGGEGGGSVMTSNFDYAQGSDGEVIRMTTSQLQKLVSSYRQFSLSDAGTRKRKQLQARLAAGLDQIGYAPLRGSHIIQPDEIEFLYYCLPFFSKPPTLKLLYSTHTHRRSLDELFSKTIKVGGTISYCGPC